MGVMRSQREQLRNEWLVLRCQEGDVAAFEALVAAWQERLWRHALGLCGDADAAYDILQDAWLAIERGLGRLSDPAAFPAWAYRIVSNKCRDWIRREARRRRGIQAFTEVFTLETGGGADHGGGAGGEDERCDDLRQALARLSGPDRALLALKYEEDFDTAQIAEALGVPEGTIRSRLFYLRQRLKTLMQDKREGTRP